MYFKKDARDKYERQRSHTTGTTFTSADGQESHFEEASEAEVEEEVEGDVSWL